MKFTQNIVRIGGQSKCAALEPFSLREWRNQATTLRKRPGEYRHWLYDARDKLSRTKGLVVFFYLKTFSLTCLPNIYCNFLFCSLVCLKNVGENNGILSLME
jgi:hypothetical protein